MRSVNSDRRTTAAARSHQDATYRVQKVIEDLRQRKWPADELHFMASAIRLQKEARAAALKEGVPRSVLDTVEKLADQTYRNRRATASNPYQEAEKPA